jgi:cytochrome P450
LRALLAAARHAATTCSCAPTSHTTVLWRLPRTQWGDLHTAPRTWTAKWPLAPRFFFTADPAVVEHVLKSRFEAYEKGAIVRSAISDLLGRGIFTSDGPRWKEQRRTAAHMFSLRQFRETIMGAFTAHVPELVSILDGAAAGTGTGTAGTSSSRAPPQQIDLQSLFFRFTLDSIGDIAFGDSVGSLSNPALPFARAFDGAQSIVEHRFVSPLWQLWERLDGTHARLQAALRVLHDYAQRLIDARRAAGDYE